MLQLFKRKGLRFKLLLYFITLILLPVATLGIIGNLVSVQTLEDEANNHTTQMIDQVKKNVDFYLQSVKQSIQLISLDPETIQFINTNPSASSERRQSTETGVRRILSSLTSIHPEIAGIIIVNENDMDISNEMFRVSRDPLTSEDWYQKAMEHPGQLQLISKRWANDRGWSHRTDFRQPPASLYQNVDPCPA
jgi:two-component system sensor histidine kinase YesM